MKCRSHPYETGVGVCAPCLRERLLALIAAQLKLSEEETNRPPPPAAAEPPPPLPAFPRSVSPYICRLRRRSVNDTDPRFYSTPQIGAASAAGGRGRRGRFSIFSSLFGSRSEEVESESKPSWLSSLFSGRRRKKSRPAGRPEDWGLSPVASDGADSPESESGCSTDSSGGWRRTATHPTPMRRRGAAPPPHMRTLSGLSFCLSPHVRAGSRPNRAQKSEPVSAEFHHRHVCANRSRKIADFGRDWFDKNTTTT
ncbi:hypothetical protein QJS04_geneDACA008733 [Acorus gramineus]|uniref:Uncharacterized protein n=1 Tax=Acorus gramineus TaxID=55184 RepID=A0AAV9ABL0_ACOGR|nr:hypothetical protein QJS04_geneDACA008733 [Acorus gramineus]